MGVRLGFAERGQDHIRNPTTRMNAVIRRPVLARAMTYGVVCAAISLAAWVLHGFNAAVLVTTFIVVGLCAIDAGSPKTSSKVRMLLILLAGMAALLCGYYLEMTPLEHAISVLFGLAVAAFGRRLFVP